MGINAWQIGILLLVVVLVFGTSKLKNMGKDLGGAVKGFKKAMNEEESKVDTDEAKQLEQKQQDATFDDVKEEDKEKNDTK
jgi:sec-independent protein translocase protein TatA